VAKTTGFHGDFFADMQEIEHLRNQIAHATIFVANDEDARISSFRIETAERRIGLLQEPISPRIRE